MTTASTLGQPRTHSVAVKEWEEYDRAGGNTDSDDVVAAMTHRGGAVDRKRCNGDEVQQFPVPRDTGRVCEVCWSKNVTYYVDFILTRL